MGDGKRKFPGQSADKLTATRQNPTPLTQRRTQVKENQVLMIVI
jgi:hypothetical protein